MNSLQAFHFLRPWWLIALIPLAVLVHLIATKKLGQRSWEQVCDKHLLPYILIGRQTIRQKKYTVIIALCGLLGILALAGPTWKRLPQPVYRSGSHLVIVLDLSLSMYANDLKPDRLSRARFEISDLLKYRREGETGLLVYAGDAFTVTPLTDDNHTIELQLPALSPDIMPVPGSATDVALKKAEQLLKQAGAASGHILLITDEVDNRYADTFRKLSQEGYHISIMGIGTADGAPIPLPKGGYLKDTNGAIVVPHLDSRSLANLAHAGGGLYMESRLDDQDSQQLEKYFNDKTINKEKTSKQLTTDTWQEFGPWLLLLIIPFAAAGFRRGILILFFCCYLPFPQAAHAFDLDQLWLNSNQRGKQALENNNPKQASELFRDPDWKAAAEYKAKNYSAVDKLLKDKKDVNSIYNRANALARMGKFEDAIKNYDRVLKNDPGHEDARYNRDLVRKMLQKQQQNQQSQGGKQQDSSSQNKSQSRKGKQQSDSKTQQDKQQSASSDQTQSGSQKESPENASSNKQNNETSGEKQNQSNQEQPQAKAGNKPDQMDKSGKSDKLTKPINQDQPAVKQNGSSQEQGAVPQSIPEKLDEKDQASEQWLRRIPDDPAGLLRRKFKYQYQQQGRNESTPEKYW